MKIEKELPGVKKNILLKNYTTFRIGGPAKYFFQTKTKRDLILAVKIAKKFRLPFFVLGGGSNLLVSDKGFKGLVIKIQNSKFEILNGARRRREGGGRVSSKIFTEAGTLLRHLVNATTRVGLTGLEWAVGIPGTVGGAVRGNAGAFRKSMEDIIKTVEAFDTKTGKIKTLKSKDCKFGYRDSIFKKNKNLIILSAMLQLKKGRHPPATRKKKIKNKIQKNLEQRKRTQPLNFPSAGSVFKNPQGFSTGELGEEDKSSSSAFAAARLIEECGLKGKRIGNVKIFEKHANFIVNLGGGKGKDVMGLIKIIKNRVKKKFEVVLEEEIQFLGF